MFRPNTPSFPFALNRAVPRVPQIGATALAPHFGGPRMRGGEAGGEQTEEEPAYQNLSLPQFSCPLAGATDQRISLPPSLPVPTTCCISDQFCSVRRRLGGRRKEQGCVTLGGGVERSAAGVGSGGKRAHTHFPPPLPRR